MGTGVAGVPLRELGLILLVAATLTYLTTGMVRTALIKGKMMAGIRERDVHTVPTPRMGGVAMATGFLCAMYLAQQLPALTRGFEPVTPEMKAVMFGGVVVVFVGVIDDLFDLDAITKLAGQLVGAFLLSFLGVSWTLVYIPGAEGGTTVILDGFWSTLVTVLFTLTLINAINFVDGLDGLAAGLGMIAGGAILVFSLTVLHDQGGMVSAYPPAIISALLVGVCAGFLPHNFEPARIFMGDSGAMFIGFLLAAAVTSASGKINMSLYGTGDLVALIGPVIIAIAAVAVPTLDLILAVVRRVSQGKSPFSADRKHLHHRLLDIGHTHRRVALVLYLWAGTLSFTAVLFSVVPTTWAIGSGVVLLCVAVVATIKPAREAHFERHHPEG